MQKPIRAYKITIKQQSMINNLKSIQSWEEIVNIIRKWKIIQISGKDSKFRIKEEKAN